MRVLYEVLIACLIAECCAQSLFPERNGCSGPYDDIDDKCIHTVYCKNFISLSASRHGECNNLVGHPNYGNTYDPINVIFTDDTSHEQIPGLESSNYFYIYSLDLSDNSYASLPILERLENLAILKITRCALTTAKLSNKNELPALIHLDYSDNRIENIEVVPGEHEYKKLEILNISHNWLINIPDAIFESLDNLQTLDLSHNFLSVLDTLYFEGIKKLLNLNLSNNKIVNIDSSLGRFRYLVTLDLGHNDIETLRAKDFVKLVNLREIKLDSNKINAIETKAFENMVSLTTIDLRENFLGNIDQELFTNTTNLITVYLSENKLKKLPKNMFKNQVIFHFTIEGNELEGALERGTFEGFSMVTELDLSGQHLNSIEDYAFAGLQKLNTLLLNNNDVEMLGNYSFKGLSNLKCLDLSYNNIEIIDIVTEDLSSLQILSLNHNKIAHISSNNFIAMGSLKILDLSNNNISHLGSNAFRSLQSLLNFKIANNPLCGTIEEKTFDGFSSLPSLDVSGTLITSINNGSFMGMTLLRELNVSHGSIIELQYNALSYVSNIQIIDLSYNQLSMFDVNTTDLKYLKTLMLHNNMLQVVSQTFFNDMTVLSTVDLSHNHIHTIDKEAFYTLKDLQNLELSYNPELKFDVALVEKAQHLDRLFLSGTKIEVKFNYIPLTRLEMAHSSIPNLSDLNLYSLQRLETLVVNNNVATKLQIGALSNLTALTQLDLSYNNLSFIQPGAFEDNTHLLTLNISHNQLKEISYGIFHGLVNLIVLDLSYNKIKSLHRTRFYDVERLNTLIVDHNEIDFISEDEFLGTSLYTLSIGGNPLPCEIVANMYKKHTPHITAVNIDVTNISVKGITCHKDSHTFHSELNTGTIGNGKLLLDIKNILYKISKEDIVKEQVAIQNESPFLANITEQQQKLNIHSLEIINSIKNLSVVSNSNSIINSNTNVLLGKILRVLTSKEPLQTSKPIVVVNENATSENLLPYINKIKQDLEDTLAIEKQNVLELDNKIEKLNSRIDSSSLTTKTPVHEKLVGNKEITQKSSMFTEVCVGLILVILVGFVLYKAFESKLYLPRRRSTTSTRNIAEAMESSPL